MSALLRSRLTTYGTLLLMILLIGSTCASCFIDDYING